MNKALVEAMDECGEYFATVYEIADAVEPDGATVRGSFAGKYRAGDLVRIHGSHTSLLADMGAGSVYEVVSFDGNALELDRPLHTRGWRLLIALLEPPQEFERLCADIEEWRAKHASMRGLASESIDGYSWSAANGGAEGWQGAFKSELRRFKSAQPTKFWYLRNCRSWQ